MPPVSAGPSSANAPSSPPPLWMAVITMWTGISSSGGDCQMSCSSLWKCSISSIDVIARIVMESDISGSISDSVDRRS